MREPVRRTWSVTYHTARRIAIAVIGGTIVLLGVAMLVLPGPGLLTILGGLAVLGIEFAFARRWLRRAKNATRKAARTAAAKLRRPEGPRPPVPHA